MLVGMSAFIVAVPLSYLVAQGLISEFEATFDIGYDPIALVIGLIGMIVITVLASLGPSLGAARRTVSAISSGPHHQDSGEAKIRESTAGVSRKPSSDGKARGSSSKHLCGLTAWNT